MAGELTTTLGELRRSVAQLLGDLIEVTATINGTTATLTDVIRLGTQIESPKHGDIIFTSGLNAGAIRRITDADLGTGTVAFELLDNQVLAGDTAEIHNLRAKGWPVYEKHNAINQALNAAWPAYKEPYTVELADLFDLNDPVLSVPSGMTHVAGVQYQTSDGDWIDLPSIYWNLDRYLGEVTVSGRSFLSTMDGLAIRLVGGKRPEPLTVDSDTTTVRPDYVMYQAAAFLCQRRYNLRQEAEFYNQQILNQQYADRFKPRSRGTGVAVRSA
jgi:hypothetical protein